MRDNKVNDLSGIPLTENHTFDPAHKGYHQQTVDNMDHQEDNSMTVADDDSSLIYKLNGIARKMPLWTKSWMLWSLILILIPGSIGFVGISMLFKLPSSPKCPEVFWPLASASVRLHCAQIAASKQTIDDLLQAIDLVKQLPENHPLRGEINRQLEQWSEDILKLADQSFQAGNLEEAIATAHKIPPDVNVSQLVDKQIEKWQSIWSKAEAIYQEAEQELRQRNWQSAFMLTSKLLRVNNEYWASTKYDELNNIIVTTREDGDKLYKAEALAKNRNLQSLLQAIKLARTVKPNSYLYQKSQELITEFAQKMLKLAQSTMQAKDADTALEIARKIPPVAELQVQVDDFIMLGEAQRSAFLGTISGLETAISQAQQIDASREIYSQAQELIARWQLEIEDISRLEKARNLASQGTINDLTSAIAEAQQIPTNNPRSQEARREVARWVDQVETIEDRPYIERAEQIAVMEDVNSLQAAIAEASQIRPGRALYFQARQKIRDWTAKVERIQDQPLLEQATALADSGNLQEAVKTAQKIAVSGRALSKQAQTAVDTWQEQINARQNWQKAQQLALAGTPESLSQAIKLANRVSSRNVLRLDVNIAIDQWSQEILNIARSQSEVDIAKAIDIAKLVPAGSSAYRDAQQEIQNWQQFMIPKSLSTPSFQPSLEATPPLTPEFSNQ
ncbi:chromosome segregation ATPase [Anabaena sp. FACHB-1237]|nr:chromosome segregation ATPase [Anabaena sp. FACHB-1237]